MFWARFLRNSNGFSTMELVVATGIVGAMMSMAVPSYQSFVAKSHQGEGKASLARVFAVEQSFYQEWGWYTLCLKQAGFTAETKRFYMVGFLWADGTGGQYQGLYSKTEACSFYPTEQEPDHNDATWNATEMVNPESSSEMLNQPYQTWDSSAAGPAGFKAFAAGSISDSRSRDVWQIDATRTIKNTSSGL